MYGERKYLCVKKKRIKNTMGQVYAVLSKYLILPLHVNE